MDLSSWSSRCCSSMVSVVNGIENDTWTRGDKLLSHLFAALTCEMLKCQEEKKAVAIVFAS